MRDEGVIKFDCRWTDSPAPPAAQLSDLIAYRNRLFEMNLIGVYPDGIGFGNISAALPVSASPNTAPTPTPPRRSFIISASQTGHIPQVSAEQFVLVDDYGIDGNWVSCSGPLKASSESLTHAMIYDTFEEARAVIHVHSHDNWKQLIGKIPTSRADVPYGTPAMAHEVERLALEENLSRRKVFVMAGHEDGILSFGSDLADAFAALETALAATTRE